MITYCLILIGDFGDLLSLKQKRYSLVAFTGLEGVNNFFSHVSLILVATFSIFTKSLLTSFLELVHHTCAPMFLEQNAWVSQKQDSCGNLVVASLPLNFSFSASAESVCCEHPMDWTWLIPFFLTKILELTLSCISQATQYSPSMESPKDIQLVNKGLLLLVRWQLSHSRFAPRP